MKKIKVLIITYYPWREDNNVGNSYSNLFNGMTDKIDFSQIYIRDGLPQNTLAHDYFHISDIKLLKSFLGKGGEIGEYIYMDNTINNPKDTFSKAFNKARVLRWDILLLLRELAGYNPQWKSHRLNEFLDKVEPDIIFGTLPPGVLVRKLMLYSKKYTKAKLITYPWDDYYSLNHQTWSLIFWIRKFMGRYNLMKAAKQSEFLYVISDIMKMEYSKIFSKECKLLYKGHGFGQMPEIKPIGKTIKVIYMGNIGGGRWKALASLASSIDILNKEFREQKILLNIYTLSARTKEIDNALNIEGSSAILPSVNNDEVQPTMNSADILLHVEPWSGKEKSFYRASFSTKIVDYFYAAKCIFAVGGSTASTDYLKNNDAAIVVNEERQVKEALRLIIDNPSLISQYARKAWRCGYENHQIEKIQEMIYNDFKTVNK